MESKELGLNLFRVAGPIQALQHSLKLMFYCSDVLFLFLSLILKYVEVQKENY